MPGMRFRTNPFFGWWGILLVWIAWGTINSSRLRVVAHIDWATAFWYGMPDALIWAALTPLVVHLSRRFAGPGVPLGRTLAWHVAGATLIAVLHVAADVSVSALRALAAGRELGVWALFVKLMFHNAQSNFLTYFLVSGFTHYLDHSRRLARRESANAELRGQLTEARLRSLEMQLRPHFLFNALHTISGLTVSDPKLGQRVIRQLGDLLRMSLRNRDQHFVSLDEELAFVEAYLEVEKARFGDRLEIDVRVDDEVRCREVPAFILQPLVENAVRHGVSKSAYGGTIRIRASSTGERLRLEVHDNGPGIEAIPADDNGGVGLSNTRRRLEVLYGDPELLMLSAAKPNGVLASIELPPEIRSVA